MFKKCFSFLFFVLLLFPFSTFAWNEGVFLSVPVVSKDPSPLHGFNLGIWYDPETLVWRQFNLYFDLLGAHYWVNSSQPYNDTNIVAFSPVVRYTFKEHFKVKPFFEFSIGLSYITNTRFGNRNLGMHFSFQDRAGLGILLGARDQFYLGAHVVHYSNASLSSHNSGITIPLLLDIGYKF